jgi:predicted metal-dependent hydrolase
MEKVINGTDSSTVLLESKSIQNGTQGTPITAGNPADFTKADNFLNKHPSWIAKADEAFQQDKRVRPWANAVGDMVSWRDPLAYRRYDDVMEKDLMLRDETECPGLAASVSLQVNL